MAAPPKSSSPHRIKVKKELGSEPDNIKDFAETAMNDILGWYGYGDSVDRIDITLPMSAAPAPTGGGESNRCSTSSNTNNKDNNNGTSKGSSTLKSKHSKAQQQQQQQQHKSRQFNMRQHNSGELRDTIASVAAVVASGVASPASSSSSLGKAAATSSASIGGGGNNTIASTNNSNDSRGSCINNNNSNNNNNTRNGVNLHHHGESSTSEKDSSRESSKSPLLVKMLDKPEPVCQWCCRGVPPNQTGILGTTEGTIFCSESCFSQSRRASFKRAKTCDWCRHVRHAVSYVDFQDGVTQLQFCSDKCLNQYKMQIFCNETQAHLDMNPHLKEKSTSTGGNLITPDLWLKNCRSRSASPATDRSESTSPTPSLPMRPSPEPSPAMQSSPIKKPLISVAPVSKLLSKNLQVTISRSPAKATRKRRTALRPVQQTALGGSRRIMSSKGDFSQISHNNNNNNSNVLNNNLTVSSTSILSKQATAISSTVSDLRATISIPKLPHPKKFETLDSPSNPRPALNLPPPYLQLPPAAAAVRHPFFPMNPAFRFGTPPPQSPMPPPPPVTNLPPNIDSTIRPPSSLLGLPAPPVTILVPYPIVIPLPLPIPIPIPLIDFLKATTGEKSSDSSKVEPEQSESPTSNTEQPSISRTETRTVISEAELEEDRTMDDSPLDFTTVSHEQRRQRDATVMLPFEQPTSGSMPEAESYSLEAVSQDEQTMEDDDKSPEQKLPKFKITRVGGLKCVDSSGEGIEQSSLHERLTSVEKKLLEEKDEEESRDMVERSRPLRKRKRLAMVHHEQQVDSSRMRESDSRDGKG
ncbi:sine oculis-binding protein homolog [Sabethes cyaneus]|uniref:sine oculis-binding protein homolog n=1 Tax=Sabethes cyaneus TaxID=53552 RepID=UPI00237DD797|nr:sine oculis-binding protein homolog [Sabethes cyaneus]